MTIKVHGAAYPGIWVEKQVIFVTVKFATDIGAQANYSGFDVVESCIVQALKYLELSSTVLGVSVYDTGSTSFQAMLGYAAGVFAPANDGIIATAIPVTGAAQDNTQVPPAPLP